METGATVRAAVLDVAKTERLVDLSLKLEFLDNCIDEGSNCQSRSKVKFCFMPPVSVALHMKLSIRTGQEIHIHGIYFST